MHASQLTTTATPTPEGPTRLVPGLYGHMCMHRVKNNENHENCYSRKMTALEIDCYILIL